MRRDAGFTLVELMVVIAISGVLCATAVQTYHTLQRRAYGSEAVLMLKQIVDAEIMYFLAKERFFPEVGEMILIFHGDPPSKAEITQTKEALQIGIPVGHFLDYTITTAPGPTCMVTISSFGNSFALFRDGARSITGVVDSTGRIDIL